MAKTTVHFHGGTYDGKGRHFEADPAPVLVIPVGDGYFERYRRANETMWAKYDQAEEQAVQIYKFSERFEGVR